MPPVMIGTTDTAIPPGTGLPLHSGTMNATFAPATNVDRTRSAGCGSGWTARAEAWLLAGILTITLLAGRAVAQTTVTFDSFGLGNAYRPGGPVAARVVITSDLDSPTPAIVEWEIQNPDGDRQVNQRPIEIPARGGTATTWLIGDLPSRIDPLSVAEEPWIVRVFEYREGRRVQEVASARLAPSVCGSRAVPQSDGLAIVLGPNDAGLSGYTNIPGRGVRPGLNECLDVVINVEPRDLPDHWAGFEQADLIVWTADEPRFQPGTLGTRFSVEGALRSWIERGGHLVIALPRSGDPWRLDRGDGVLDDLLEGVVPITDSDYPLQEALPALTVQPGLRDPDRTITLHRFDPSTLPPAWRPLAGFEPSPPPFDPQSVAIPPDANPAVAERLREAARQNRPRPTPVIHAIRRDVGHGTIDILGIDPSDPDLRVQQSAGLPTTWVFWNPILGRRAFTPTTAVIDRLASRRELVQNAQTIALGSDRLISDEIGQSVSANSGILLGMLLFGGYWLLAGPLGFMILGRVRRRRHAWPAFAATSMIAAVIAWGVGELAVVSDTSTRHLTILRHRYIPASMEVETPLDHATCWFSSRLPSYGTADVAVGDQNDAEMTGTNLISHFSPPPNGQAGGFLDSARYEVDVRRRDRMSAPARATSSEFVVDWLGVPEVTDDAWSSTINVAPDAPVQLRMLDRNTAQITGTLINRTGVVLKNVLVLLVSSTRSAPLPLNDTGLPGIPGTAERLTAQVPNIGSIVAVSLNAWQPDDAVQLGGASGVFGTTTRLPEFGKSSLGGELDARYFVSGGFDPTFGDPTLLRPLESRRELEGLCLFNMLPPPAIVQTGGGERTSSRFIRLLGRDLDLSRHLCEPGVVVLAFAEEAPCPVPLRIEGERVRSEGTVILQWVHPLWPDIDRLVPPRPAIFEDDPDQSQALLPPPDSQLQGVAAAWR